MSGSISGFSNNQNYLCPKKKNMRRFLLCAVLGIIVATAIIPSFKGEDTEPYVEKLGRLIRLSRLQTVRDDDFGFSFKCPTCFHDDEYDSIPSHFHYVIYPPSIYRDAEGQVELECYASINNEGLTLQQLADSIEKQVHPSSRKMLKDGFIVAGPLYMEGSRIPGHHFYAKYVMRQKAVFVYSISYPEGYDSALERVKNLIDEWQP